MGRNELVEKIIKLIPESIKQRAKESFDQADRIHVFNAIFIALDYSFPVLFRASLEKKLGLAGVCDMLPIIIYDVCKEIYPTLEIRAEARHLIKVEPFYVDDLVFDKIRYELRTVMPRTIIRTAQGYKKMSNEDPYGYQARWDMGHMTPMDIPFLYQQARRAGTWFYVGPYQTTMAPNNIISNMTPRLGQVFDMVWNWN